ncbi:Retrovirus-related Pol polyprotein from transposon [Dictyocoela muelleri]|nr:Retrovirus-related Pol polyprotein from transposon [Dictyocoela muelleri]
MGGILKQEENILGIFSYKFNENEENYSVVEKETLSIIKSVLHFNNSIFNSNIIFKTDNRDQIHEASGQKNRNYKILLEEFSLKFNTCKATKIMQPIRFLIVLL